MLRRPLSAIAALGVLAEAIAFCGLLYVFLATTREYSVAMADRSPGEAVITLWVLIGLLGVFLLAVTAVLVVSAVGSELSRSGRILVIAAMPPQWILMVVGGLLLNWEVFIGLLVVFGLLLGVLIAQPPRVTPVTRSPRSIRASRSSDEEDALRGQVP